MKRLLLLSCLGVCLPLRMGAAPDTLRYTLPPDQLDLSQCLAQPGAVPIPLSETNLNLELVDWAAAPTASNQPGEFLLTLKQPMSAGCVLTYGASQIQYSTGGVWNPLPPGQEAGRPLQLIPFPKGARVEAVRITVLPRPDGENAAGPAQFRATLPFATLIPARLQRAAGETLITLGSGTNRLDLQGAGRPAFGSPQALLDGRLDPERNFATAPRPKPASLESPEWILLSWPKPRAFRGLMLLRGRKDPGLGNKRIELYVASGDPRQSNDLAEWQFLQGSFTPPGAFGASEFFIAFHTLTGSGLRFSSVGGVSQIGLGEILILQPAQDP